MKVHLMEQRSPEWRAIRCGKLTASCAADMLATTQKKEWAAGRKNYRMRLVLERITGKPQESGYLSQAMQDGMDREIDAQGIYEAVTGNLLRSVGFVEHDTLMAGCSPDGVIGNFEGIAEIKCPMAATHMEYLRTGIVPGDYLKQITAALWITGAQWCDWLSFHPDFPEYARVKLVRVDRDEAAIAAFDQLARDFLAEVDAGVAELEKLAGVPA